jgi:hypothetical protein
MTYRILLASACVIVVVAVVVTLVVVKASSRPGTAASASEGPVGAALHSLVAQVTGEPAGVLDCVGAGSLASGDIGTASPGSSYLAGVTGPPLTSGGKPEVLYIGANYCPYCAAERWALIVALSRLGTFSGLSTIHSSSTDDPANVSTFTFYGSTYTSRYLSFAPVEETQNYRVGNSASPNVPYVTLQVPSAAQQALIDKYDPGTGGQGGFIPFIYIGNRYVQVGDLAPYGPRDLQGMTWSQIAAALRDPSSTVAQDIIGSANYLTAAICKVTGNQPASVCTAAVRALERNL